METGQHTEHFIPISQKEILEHLMEEGKLTSEDTKDLRRFYEILKSLFHFEFHSKLEDLKDNYHRFDPDPSTRPSTDTGEYGAALEDFKTTFNELMERANFSELTPGEIEDAFDQSTPLAVNVDVDLNAYETLHLYSRGKKKVIEKVPFMVILKRNFQMEIYERLVMMAKFAGKKRMTGKGRLKKTALGMEVEEDKIYLKYFKNVPVADIEMIFPNPRIRMSRFDKLKISIPLITALVLIYGSLGQVVGGNTSQSILIGLGSVLGLYAARSIISYRNTRIKYIKSLTQGLYFKNLDNNSGVFHTVMNEAEEEEVKEAILAYYFLHITGGMKRESLDSAIEEWFRNRFGIELDFDVEDALSKLERLELIHDGGNGTWFTVPLKKALEKIDGLWDCLFPFNTGNGPHKPESQ